MDWVPSGHLYGQWSSFCQRRVCTDFAEEGGPPIPRAGDTPLVCRTRGKIRPDAFESHACPAPGGQDFVVGRPTHEATWLLPPSSATFGVLASRARLGGALGGALFGLGGFRFRHASLVQASHPCTSSRRVAGFGTRVACDSPIPQLCGIFSRAPSSPIPNRSESWGTLSRTSYSCTTTANGFLTVGTRTRSCSFGIRTTSLTRHSPSSRSRRRHAAATTLPTWEIRAPAYLLN